MKKLVGVLASIILMTTMVQIGLAQNSSDDKTTAAITKIERDWEKAMQNKDDASVGKIVGDDWVGVNPDGSTMGKSDFLTQVKKGDFSSLKLESVNVKSFGKIAVATGKASDPKLGNVIYMDVFMREGGGWKAIASQVGAIPQTK